MTDKEQIKELQDAVYTLNERIEALYKMIRCIAVVIDTIHPYVHLTDSLSGGDKK